MRLGGHHLRQKRRPPGGAALRSQRCGGGAPEGRRLLRPFGSQREVPPPFRGKRGRRVCFSGFVAFCLWVGERVGFGWFQWDGKNWCKLVLRAVMWRIHVPKVVGFVASKFACQWKPCETMNWNFAPCVPKPTTLSKTHLPVEPPAVFGLSVSFLHPTDSPSAPWRRRGLEWPEPRSRRTEE